MSETVTPYRWSAEGFVRAWEAGAFDGRVELVNGEVWPVVIGDWHGRITGRLVARLATPGFEVTSSTLASGESLPDPDCWVQVVGAEPAGTIGLKLSRWRPQDVLLVAEVSDETMLVDLTVKAALYGSSGYPEYWVVTPQAVFVHTDPAPTGYLRRVEHPAGSQVTVPYSGRSIDVTELVSV